MNFDEKNEVSRLVLNKSCFMRSIAVHLLLIYSNDLKTHLHFLNNKETQDLASDEQIQKKIYNS